MTGHVGVTVLRPDIHINILCPRRKIPGEEYIMRMKAAPLALFGVCCTLAAASLLAQDTQANAPGQPGAQQVQRRPQSDKWKLALETDPADLKTYRAANAALSPPASGENRVVFIGDSITAGWGRNF